MAKHDHDAIDWEVHRRSRAISVLDDRIDSRDLFSDSRVVTIVHGSQTYQLRLTSQNKLILTK